MKLLLSSLLFSSLCTLSSWSVSSGTNAVRQSPDVSVMDGDTVNISCCWRREGVRIRVSWLKNQTCVKNETFNCSRAPVKNDSDICLNLTFSNITRKDSGSYICEVHVDIPLLKVHHGNGTVITVKARENTMDPSSRHNSTAEPSAATMAAAVATVVPLLIITLVCFCILRRKQGDAARVIYEVPHVDSEVPEMDKQSTSSSRGSSQWCQVPVYESFDYFEHMPKNDKESG